MSMCLELLLAVSEAPLYRLIKRVEIGVCLQNNFILLFTPFLPVMIVD